MKREKILSVLLIICLIFLSGCSKGTITATDAAEENKGNEGNVKKEVWKVAAMSGEDLPLVRALLLFAKELNSRIETIDVQVFANGQLGSSPDQVLGGIQNGIIEMGEMAVGNCAEYTKAFIPIDIPYLFLSREQAIAFMQNEEAFEIIRDRIRKEADLELICFLDLGFRQMTNSKRPITRSEDFKDLKIRTMANNVHMKAFESLGAKPTVMAFSEVFTALQQKTIDGQENPIDVLYLQKFHEANKYVTMTDHVYAIEGFFMNAKKYENLSDEIKNAIAECVPIIQKQDFDETKISLDESVKLVEADGAKINYIDDLLKKELQVLVEPSWDLAKKTCGEEYFNKIIDIIKNLN